MKPGHSAGGDAQLYNESQGRKEPRLNARSDHSFTRNALIFRTELLRYSETFIPSQAEKFQIFTPFYAGFRAMHELPLPGERAILPFASRATGRANNLSSVFGWIDPGLVGAVRSIHPEFIHAHFEPDALKALPLATQLKVPLFLTCHGNDVTVERQRWQNRPFLGKYYQGRRRDLFKTATLCLGISRFICDQMLRRGYPSEKVRLHYIGIDTELFRPDPTITKLPMILYVGRLVEKKGCIDLLQAMKLVNARYPDIKLNIIGDGPLKEQLEKFAENEKLNAHFLGIQSPRTVQNYLQTALLFSMPSLRAQTGDSEGLGIVNLEAQAVGVPVVATSHGGIPEAVEHGVTGLLSAEHDPQALAENILTLLSDTDLRTRMGQAARNRMVEHFDLSTQSNLLEQTYLEFL